LASCLKLKIDELLNRLEIDENKKHQNGIYDTFTKRKQQWHPHF